MPLFDHENVIDAFICLLIANGNESENASKWKVEIEFLPNDEFDRIFN